jgi:hypothetical protein
MGTISDEYSHWERYSQLQWDSCVPIRGRVLEEGAWILIILWSSFDYFRWSRKSQESWEEERQEQETMYMLSMWQGGSHDKWLSKLKTIRGACTTTDWATTIATFTTVEHISDSVILPLSVGSIVRPRMQSNWQMKLLARMVEPSMQRC